MVECIFQILATKLASLRLMLVDRLGSFVFLITVRLILGYFVVFFEHFCGWLVIGLDLKHLVWFPGRIFWLVVVLRNVNFFLGCV